MPIQSINLGSYANDGTGDDLRTAFEKVNANFTFLNAGINIGNAANIGSGTGIFKQKNGTNLEFKTLTSLDDTVLITQTANAVNLESNAKLESDPNPVLSSNLDLNGFDIVDTSGGSTSSINVPIFGISVPIMNSLLELLLTSNSISVDMGGIREDQQAGATLDLGYFTGITYPNNNLDFGRII
jgi:hypothetical protein